MWKVGVIPYGIGCKILQLVHEVIEIVTQSFNSWAHMKQEHIILFQICWVLTWISNNAVEIVLVFCPLVMTCYLWLKFILKCVIHVYYTVLLLLLWKCQFKLSIFIISYTYISNFFSMFFWDLYLGRCWVDHVTLQHITKCICIICLDMIFTFFFVCVCNCYKSLEYLFSMILFSMLESFQPWLSQGSMF